MAKAYRVYFKKVPLDQGGYTMDHTAIIYLMDKDGRITIRGTFVTSHASAANRIRGGSIDLN